jgi:hypothetical protein
MKTVYPTIVIDDCELIKVPEYLCISLDFAEENDIPVKFWYKDRSLFISFEVEDTVDEEGDVHGKEEAVWRFNYTSFEERTYIKYSSAVERNQILAGAM